MRIAYLSDQSLPNPVATSDQLVNTVAALAEAGAAIDLILPGAVDERALAEYYGVGDRFGVRQIIGLPAALPRLRKVAHGVLGPLSARANGYDLIYTRNALPAAVGLLLGQRVLFETYHMLAEHRPRTARLLERLSRSPRFIAILAHSVPARDSLLSVGVAEHKVIVMPNGFNPAALATALDRDGARALLDLPVDRPIACYTGRIGIDKGSLFLLEMAARTPEVTYLLVGPTEQSPHNWLERKARARGVDNLHCRPAVPPSELGKFLYAADVLLIPPTAAPMQQYGRTVLPIKTYLYMAAGRPIVAPDQADTAGLLTKQNSLLVAPDDDDAAAHAVRDALSNPERSRMLAATAKADSENYTWQRRAERILAILEQRKPGASG